MDGYSWSLGKGMKAELCFSTNFDNLIHKSRNGKVLEGAFLIDCGIVHYMPYILRYCFEESVNLKQRPFLRDLPYTGVDTIDTLRLDYDFQRPLRKDAGTIRSVSGDLIINSFPVKMSGSVSFHANQVPRFVEGILRVLDCDGIRGAQIKSSQTIQYYYQCLDKGILR
jgi:hypothetical protein